MLFRESNSHQSGLHSPTDLLEKDRIEPVFSIMNSLE